VIVIDGERLKNIMKGKRKERELEDEMRPEYDFSKMKIVGRGIYRERYRSGTNLVLLEPDVRKAFPDDESVNEALRVLAKAAKRLVTPARRNSTKNRRQASQTR
jgi:hypothetical protein